MLVGGRDDHRVGPGERVGTVGDVYSEVAVGAHRSGGERTGEDLVERGATGGLGLPEQLVASGPAPVAAGPGALGRRPDVGRAWAGHGSILSNGGYQATGLPDPTGEGSQVTRTHRTKPGPRRQPMKVLWVYAHPEPRSLNGALRDEGLRTLRELGHQVRESDLYAMRWNPVLDGDDYGHDPCERLYILTESQRAYESGTLSADIRTEQDKLTWADTLILQFPMWWFGPPAILKGWIDRLFVQGFAQGVIDPQTGRMLRYGNGGLAGKRAMLVTTVGGREASTGTRGIHGDLGEILFPLQHGTLWYTGISVVPPFVVHDSNQVSDAEYKDTVSKLQRRLLALPTADPIPFRHQNGGDYDSNLVLRPELAPNDSGLRVHSA